jgi:hypothetical protein
MAVLLLPIFLHQIRATILQIKSQIWDDSKRWSPVPFSSHSDPIPSLDVATAKEQQTWRGICKRKKGEGIGDCIWQVLHGMSNGLWAYGVFDAGSDGELEEKWKIEGRMCMFGISIATGFLVRFYY